MSSYPGILVSSQVASAPYAINAWATNTTHRTARLPMAITLGLICTVSAGASLTYSVQVTADPTPSAAGNWNNHDVLVNQTGSANSNVAYPITGIRLNVTSWSSGSVNLGIAQWP